MRPQKDRPRGTPEPGAAAALATNPAAFTRQPHNSTTRLGLSTQLTGADPLADLAAQALARADRAAVLADCCAAAGDWRGFELWRRRLLAHQAVAWAALHPEPLEVIP